MAGSAPEGGAGLFVGVVGTVSGSHYSESQSCSARPLARPPFGPPSPLCYALRPAAFVLRDVGSVGAVHVCQTERPDASRSACGGLAQRLIK